MPHSSTRKSMGERGLSEQEMKKYFVGAPGFEERVADVPGEEKEQKDQVKISERLKAHETADRILEECGESVDRKKLVKAFTHMSDHIREAEPATVSQSSLILGERTDQMFFIPPQEAGFEDDLVRAGFKVDERSDEGIVVKTEDGTTITFFYNAEMIGDTGKEPSAETDEETAEGE